ncbi:MAG: hypothetical protein ACW96U_07835 [Candidatus Heimdallarchaeaceae archaeon]|jgi:glucan phosphoethanolaminetransferase (alkaline phosphatase superfamily)
MRIRIKYTVAHKFNFDIMSTEQVEAARALYYRRALFFLICGSASVISTIICIILYNFTERILVPGILFFVFLLLAILFFWRRNIFDNGRKDCDAELEKRTKSLDSAIEEESDNPPLSNL